MDLFAGVGGFRFGMERAGHQCVGYVEWDKFARKSYEAIHQVTDEWTRQDITKVTDEEWRELHGRVDIITAGFPCQAFSIAGKRRGFQDTRGTMFFEIARASQQIQPQFLFLENVKGLLNHDKGNTFRTILSTLDELGFDVEWCVCNNKWFGIPQNRERTFIIARLRGCGRSEVFPVERKDRTTVTYDLKRINDADKTKELVGFDVLNRFYDVSGISPTITTHEEPKIMVIGNVNPSERGMGGKVYHSEARSPTLTAGTGESPKIMLSGSDIRKLNRSPSAKVVLSEKGERQPLFIREATKKGFSEARPGDSVNLAFPTSTKRRGRVGKQISHTIVTSDSQGVVTEELRIRKLTPRECWRLQSFPDWAYERAAKVVSASQLYKQAGNSVAQEVVYQIARYAFIETKVGATQWSTKN
ncbi:DNA (cytosine-5-)-methyltransferase [Enterococcus faecalis]|uniref:DNA (cytosine-5-)-methyltransferase n=1 Tax=Enterococcus faecalis TaxID=1351 RepID=UPI003137DD6D